MERTTIIDKRGTPLTHTFGELENMDFFQDTDDNLCVKIGWDRKLIWHSGGWIHCSHIESDELVIPLKASITIMRDKEGD